MVVSDDLDVTGNLDASGNLDVGGNLKIDGQLKDGDGNFGTSGQVLSSDGTDTAWINAGFTYSGCSCRGWSISSKCKCKSFHYDG